MGNGESTSRRISMQRDNEGVISISSGAMNRISETSDENEVYLQPEEVVITKSDLRNLIKGAIEQGRQQVYKDFTENIGTGDDSNEDDVSSTQPAELRKIALYWKEKFEKENTELRNLAEKQKQFTISKKQETLSNEEIERLEEEKNKLKEMKQELLQQKAVFEKERNEIVKNVEFSEEKRKQIDEEAKEKERLLREEFDRGVTNIESQIIPLQRSPICTGIQSKVLECYKENRKQPLRCAEEVKEFVQCVQAARKKLMQNNVTRQE